MQKLFIELKLLESQLRGIKLGSKIRDNTWLLTINFYPNF